LVRRVRDKCDRVNDFVRGHPHAPRDARVLAFQLVPERIAPDECERLGDQLGLHGDDPDQLGPR
jgi:hypothetical protein